MSAFRDLIQAEAKNVRQLHDAIHAKVKARGKSQAAMDEWHNACTRFHQYESLIEGQLNLIEKGHLSQNRHLRKFAITYLELDPMYFRSGYIKEMLLQKLKAVEFDKSETTRLTAILIDAVRNRGQREFRRYCKLAAVLQRPEVLEESIRLAESTDGRVASRAKLMLWYVQNATQQSRY